MNGFIKRNSEYKEWIRNLSERFRKSQLKAAVKVNSEMLKFYWSLGEDIAQLQIESKWGSGVLNAISRDLQQALPGVKGLSVTNLGYIKRFYLIYSQCNVIYPQLGGKLGNLDKTESPESSELELLFSIPWGHHKYIIDKCYDNPEKAFFYVKKTILNNWSRAVLLNFLDTDLYERDGKAVSNFKETLPALQSDLAQDITKDPYNFDFLSITENYREKELKDALIGNITRFLLELGTGFAYMGREYRLQIGQTEKFLDMLFYNLTLRSYVVVEVKVKQFDSADVGQLGTYVAAVNHL